VLLSQASPATRALQEATRTIPIVFVGVADPIGSGFVASLANPGGHTTGFLLCEASITGKWLAMRRSRAEITFRCDADHKITLFYRLELTGAVWRSHFTSSFALRRILLCHCRFVKFFEITPRRQR
jgi:hypothetical protein